MITKSIVAKSISIVFHPLVMPTMGFLLLMNSGFYFSLLSFEVKKFIFLIVLLSTFLLPTISLLLLAMNPRFDVKMEKSTDRVLPLFFSSIFHFMGYYFLGKAPIYPIYRIFFIATILVIVLLMLISLKWKISNHMAAIGGVIGAILALSFRLGMNSSWLLAGLIIVAGLVGTSRLILKKHSQLQVYAGFSLGFAVNYLLMIFI